ncbi:MAG TPA: ROK family glucokinase [Candidatus Hydrogenedentes bacterium]|jgi:glucokinase|nr:MAG: Glucokinase [Candidatus Hydrogenedentes bacterium ADurb.Bin170]HOD95507.1 ROK family glucokinase [Candidatus Hydrogenedentota bacterium]HOM48917.1 ROK family glucokinase [Candidatus Hydrogenedentota bacterium]HOR50962.1 ROK family glucokinase [Candidatus Hydrogenedentota bacterium]HPX86436.1 ROK family glucokinase [Candidatus Hydrogenedentota bacterium]
MSKVVIGVDLGGTNIKAAVVSEDKKIIVQGDCPTGAAAGPGPVMDLMAGFVKDLIASAGLTMADVLAAGFGAPGPMNWRSGVVFSPPNLPGWKDVPLADEMKARLGVPCYVDNDANVACYGEYWMGAGQGAESIVVFTLGTGLGGGIVVFGELLRGIDGTAAELGHLKVQKDGRLCGCGSKGCLETYASVTGMLRTAKEGWDGADTSLKALCDNDPGKLTGKMIYEAAMSGDAFARDVFTETAVWIGLGAASMVNALNPERIILCGGMSKSGDLLYETVRKTVKENAFEVPAARCQILPAGLGNDSGVLGSAGCALARHHAASC